MTTSIAASNNLISVLESDLRQLAYDARKTEGFASFFSSSDSAPDVKAAAERAVLKLRGLTDNPTALDQLRASTDILKPLQLACDTKSARLISQALSTVQKMVSNEALSSEGATSVVNMLAQVEALADESVQLKSLQTALTLLQSPLHPTTEEGIATVLGLCFRALSQKGRKETVASTAAATVRQAVALVFSYVDVSQELDRLKHRQASEEANAAAAGSQDGVQSPTSPSPSTIRLFSGDASNVTTANAAINDTTSSPTLIASQRLLEDLIAIATGAPPTWLKTASLPRTFILETLDFALDQTSELFTSLPDFESTLSLRISQLLQAQLADYLDAGAAGAQLASASTSAFRATLRCVRTVLLRYHVQLGGRAGTLVQTLLRGLNPPHPLPQRIAVAQLVRHLLADPALVLHLFLTFDSHRDRKLDAVNALVRAAADVVDDALKPGSGLTGDTSVVNDISSAVGGAAASAAATAGGLAASLVRGRGGGGGAGKSNETEYSGPADAVDALFQARSRARNWTMDTDYESSNQMAQKAYLAMLGTDSLLLFAAAVERLTDAAANITTDSKGGRYDNNTSASGDFTAAAAVAAVDSGAGVIVRNATTSEGQEGLASTGAAASERSQSQVSVPSSSSPAMRQRRRSIELGAGEPPAVVDRDACAALVLGTWRAVLAVLSQLLARCNREALILSVLKGYQGFTQACGVLELEEPRDAFLGTLCELALTGNDGNVPTSLGIAPMSTGTTISTATEQRRTVTSIDAATGGAESPRAGGGGGGGVMRRATSPNRSLSADLDIDAGLVLTPKNIQAMRTLFNVSYRLSNVLGPAWALVLETLNTLDKVLNSPKTTTQEISSSSSLKRNQQQSGSAGNGDTTGMSSGSPSADLAILAAAAAQLFEGTKDMSDEAVMALLSGLRDVSMRNLPSAAQLSQPKLFALDRMVEVLLANMRRLPDLWAIFLAHVLEVVGDHKPLVREAAVEALGRAIVGALDAAAVSSSGSSAKQQLQQGGLGVAEKNAGGSAPATATATASLSPSAPAGLEHMLLVALEAIYNDYSDRGVRAGVLRVLLSVLQRHGERLTDGWTPVFRLLAAVPGHGGPESVALGFEALQLVSSDYLAAMDFARLKRCLEVAVAYGSQQVDLNVSLTTISLLWNVADMLGRSGAAGEDASDAVAHPQQQQQGSTTTIAKTKQKASGLASAATPAAVEELLRLIFSALQGLSRDPRPEVRNSGARTLFAVVVTQGPRLSRRLWELCLWEMLFPLLRHAFHKSITSSREEAEAALLGRSRGEQVRLVVHHSRNTEQKQWDETVVVAVGGMTRLLRAHLPAIAAMEGLEDGWDELMVVTESSLAGGRKEVALAAVGLLSGVLGAHGNDDTVVTPAMWRRALRALDVGVESATSSGCQVPLAARIETVGVIASLYSTLRSRFDADATAAAFRWAEAFCRNPWSEDDANNPVQTIGMPPVQKAALLLLPKLAPEHAPMLWPTYVRTIARLLQPVHVVAMWQEQERDNAAAAAAATAVNAALQEENGGAGGKGGAAAAAPTAPPAPPSRLQSLSATPGPLGTGATAAAEVPHKQAQHRFALNAAFLEKALEVAVDVFGAAPAAVQVETLGDVVEALGRCMELRFTVYQEKLWRSATIAFNRILPSAIASLATISAGEATTIRAWTVLAETFEDFLLGASYLKSIEGSKTVVETSSSTEASISTVAPPPSGDLPVVPILQVPSATSKPKAPTQSFASSSFGLRRGGKDATTTTKTEKSSSKHSAHPSLDGDTNPLTTSSSTSSLHAHPAVADPQQARADAELELAVLDSLTDVVLAGCGPAPPLLVRRLISIVDRGVSRPQEICIPQTLTGSNFSHVCVRKMYVLCSRAAGPDDGARLHVARLALPPFLARCDAVLRGFAEESRPGSLGDDLGPKVPQPRLDEVMCVLEVLASMSVVPAVVDAALPEGEAITEVVRALRKRPELAARGRERSHLLLLYSALCGCIACKEPRVREMVAGVLGLAGAELGLGTPLHVLMNNMMMNPS